MNSSELQELINNLRVIGTDHQSVEVKSNVGKDILHTLSAFANSNGGTIIVGLSEGDNFTPSPRFNVKVAQDQLETRCQQLSPAIRPLIEVISFENFPVLVATIEPLNSTDKPCFITERGLYKGSFTRTGDGDIRLTDYEINRMLEEKSQPKWDEQIVDEATVDDLEPKTLDKYLQLQQERRPKTFQDGQATAMRRLRITKEHHLTLAALISMGEFPQEFYPNLTVTFAHYPGSTKGDVTTGVRLLDSARLFGTIPELVSAGIDQVKKNMRTAGFIGEKTRMNLPDYPIVAVREALVNALMHRDYSPYSLGTPVQINMFVDRLQILSPGGLYGGVTLRSLGTAGVSSTRNQRLASFLEDIPLGDSGAVAENRGTGIPTIRRALSDALMPAPTIENTHSFFSMTFHKRRVAPAERHGTARDQILDILRAQTTVSTAELSERTGLSRSAIQKALNLLVDEAHVERTEPHRSPRQRYRLR